MSGLFWEDLARDLEDPDLLREYVTESVRIATVDAIINALDDARVAEGMSKAEVARSIGVEPATVRRLFGSARGAANPTLGTLAEVAAALGFRIRVEPLSPSEREALTDALRSGRASKAAIKRLTKVRDSSQQTRKAVPG
jgi:DNA-binding phage protein